jgi:5-methylcytosine-specific restriction enzyme A
MPSRAPKICCEVSGGISCHALVYDGGKRCEPHRKEAAARAWRNTDPRRSGSKRHKDLRLLTLQRDRYQCQLRYTGICIGTATDRDHIVPLYLSGPDTLENSASCCGPCHRAKSSDEGHAAQGHSVRDRPRDPAPTINPFVAPPQTPRRISMFRDDDDDNQRGGDHDGLGW